MDVGLFAQQFVNGMGTGSQYSLFAIGYGLVYQILGLMHFAHGDTLVVSLFIAFSLFVVIGLPFWLVAIVVIAIAAILAIGIERVAYRPLVERDQLFPAFIAALGTALILRNFVQLGWGVRTKVFPEIIPSETFELVGVQFSSTPFISLGLSLFVVIAFTIFLRVNRRGQAIVCLAQDRTTAALMGIPVGQTISMVYALSGAIGMLGAFIMIADTRTLTVGIGFIITLKAFIAAIVGGIGRIEGALLGGLLLGVAEAMVATYISTVYRDAIIFSLLALLLIVRPTGLMGRRQLVKF